ncbi:interleukin-1 receptor type 1-like [Cyprinus carpio]|uniref:Interleukin-1 receptor type 1-like n=1 Tax=Cyprinus carpio TaxID=7962 RepID=A0A9Q9VVG6_CYPCA|nr:interleukin-1 receptor type 1-like [Cyprinus carpio]
MLEPCSRSKSERTRAASTNSKRAGCECKAEWKYSILVCFAHEANLRNFCVVEGCSMEPILGIYDPNAKNVLKRGCRANRSFFSYSDRVAISDSLWPPCIIDADGKSGLFGGAEERSAVRLNSGDVCGMTDLHNRLFFGGDLIEVELGTVGVIHPYKRLPHRPGLIGRCHLQTHEVQLAILGPLPKKRGARPGGERLAKAPSYNSRAFRERTVSRLRKRSRNADRVRIPERADVCTMLLIAQAVNHPQLQLRLRQSNFDWHQLADNLERFRVICAVWSVFNSIRALDEESLRRKLRLERLSGDSLTSGQAAQSDRSVFNVEKADHNDTQFGLGALERIRRTRQQCSCKCSQGQKRSKDISKIVPECNQPLCLCHATRLHVFHVIRTVNECYKQATGLVVTEMTSENCVRPQWGVQRISAHVNDLLVCPLRRYLESVDSPSIQWYKNCELLQEDEKFASNKDMLYIRKVHHDDAGFYTCKLTFRLAGVIREIAETIECDVKDEYLMKPRVIEPVNEIIKVERGSSFRKDCVVEVHGKGILLVEVFWKVLLESKAQFISLNTSHRVHQEPMNESRTENGYRIVRTLSVSAVSEEDFYLNFTCLASSSRGHPTGQITLVPADPNLLLLLGLLLGSVALLFVTGVLLCTTFKVELALSVRTVFPFLYKTTDGDGKQYDAYIAYPRVLEGSSKKAEIFAMSTLPQVLEGQYGYKLFILGRDGLPGEAVVDVVQDALSRCRRLLLLYTASSLCSPEAQDWAEQQTGLYQALVEDSMSVVLLELEEIRQPLRLPHAVRLLKDKQGALQAWKRRKRWAFWDGKSEERVTSLEPSARFWREVRYHMPVRGKAKQRNWFSF